MKLLFYNDSPVFGGHEVMALLGIQGLLKTSTDPLICFSAEANTNYLEKLSELKASHEQLHIETVPWHAHKLEALRNRLKPSRARALAARIRPHNPDLIVAVQGNIEHSSLSLHAAKAIGTPCCSYIPVPHRHVEMGAKLGALRDLSCAHLFHLPDSFITCTDELALTLKRRSGGAPTHVVYNGIEMERFSPGPQRQALERFQLPADKLILGMVGRLEFKQKQQHLLVEAVAADTHLRRVAHLIFCGDGPDRNALEQLLSDRQVSGTIIPWSDTAPLYHALHALVIPSRYEGLPLVMIEALASNIPVIGSDRDGMRDLLPAAMRFDPENLSELTEILIRFQRDGMPQPDPRQVEKVRREMSHRAFQQSFADVLRHLSRG